VMACITWGLRLQEGHCHKMWSLKVGTES
jgi:hypothetical protein